MRALQTLKILLVLSLWTASLSGPPAAAQIPGTPPAAGATAPEPNDPPAAPVLEPGKLPPSTQPAASEPYFLRVRAAEVNLRCRADQNSTVVARVPRDTVVRAFREEFGWHAIAPPRGVFSLVSSDYVEERGDEGVVTVSSGALRVRVGSLLYDLDPLRSEVQRLLQPGYRVRIVGRQPGWYRIVPPEGVYLFVHGEHVERISPELAVELGGEKLLAEAPERGGPGATVTTTSQPAAVVSDAAGITVRGLLIKAGGEPSLRMGCDWKIQDAETGRALAFLMPASRAGALDFERYSGKLVLVSGSRRSAGAEAAAEPFVLQVSGLRDAEQR